MLVFIMASTLVLLLDVTGSVILGNKLGKLKGSEIFRSTYNAVELDRSVQAETAGTTLCEPLEISSTSSVVKTGCRCIDPTKAALTYRCYVLELV
jgi:hypothetical protein